MHIAGKFIIGCYDIVVDTDQDGIYYAATDALDDDDVIGCNFTFCGFIVTCCIGGVVAPINKLSILTPYIGLTSIAGISAIVALVIYGKKKSKLNLP